jgi:cytochrome c-type biogenesis protein CcmH
MQQLISRLEQRLEDNPGDQEGWLVLAQTNMVMQRYDQAVAAMERLYQLAGDSPDVLARYADSLTMVNNGRITQKASELIEQTLELDPSHVHGLWLAGVQAFQSEDFGLAVELLQKARVNISDPENLAQLDELIATAEQRNSADTGLPEDMPSQAAATVTVSVTLAPHLKEKSEAGQTVFVFAKAVSGPPMPLAVSRHKVADLPLQVTLDDSMAMMKALRLSTFEQVIISARISSSDQPLAQPGDLQGESGMVNPRTHPQVSITVNQVVE